jgi:hypothetical protein
MTVYQNIDELYSTELLFILANRAAEPFDTARTTMSDMLDKKEVLHALQELGLLNVFKNIIKELSEANSQLKLLGEGVMPEEEVKTRIGKSIRSALIYFDPAM